MAPRNLEDSAAGACWIVEKKRYREIKKQKKGGMHIGGQTG